MTLWCGAGERMQAPDRRGGFFGLFGCERKLRKHCAVVISESGRWSRHNLHFSQRRNFYLWINYD